MGIQEITLAVLFAAALFYIGRIIYRSVTAKKGCASNCNKCGVDFSDVKLPDIKP